MYFHVFLSSPSSISLSSFLWFIYNIVTYIWFLNNWILKCDYMAESLSWIFSSVETTEDFPIQKIWTHLINNKNSDDKN